MKKPGELSHIEFRTECEPPTEPGWYWAIRRAMKNPEPVEVRKGGVFVTGRTLSLPHSDFIWLGPVTMVHRA